MNQTLSLNDKPEDCSSPYDGTTYAEQFAEFYYFKADGPSEALPINPFKILCAFVMTLTYADWLFRKGLLADVVPWAASPSAFSWRVRAMVCVVSFLYMDLASGVIHLVLDYAPFHLPGLGILAKGFQYHHHDPTAIIRISWYEYVSHIHLLCPLIQVAVILGDASRLQRLFWIWGGTWAHLFQTAHRWAHTPPASLPLIVRALQSTGVLLSHESHMDHHADLERQFTILSGSTDAVLDTLSSVVPPARYDLWFLFGVLWFLLPTFADALCRDAVHALQRTNLRCTAAETDEALHTQV